MSDELDELLSAYLDGEATADEAARVEGDPGLQGRLDELRGAAALVATPVESLPAASADAMIEAAVAAHSTVAPVVVLARRRRLLTVASIAAAVLVLGAIAIGVTRSRDSSKSTSFTAVGAPLSASVPTREATGAGAGANDTSGAAAASSTVDLGDFADLDALLAAARQQSTPAPRAIAPADTAALACPPPTDATVTQVATARVNGQPVEVRFVTASDGTSAIEVIDATCGLLAYSPR